MANETESDLSAPNADMTDDQQEYEDTSSSKPKNLALACAYTGNVNRLVQSFDDQEDPHFETIAEEIQARTSSADGRTPLEVAAMLGRTDFVKEIVQRGADVNAVSCKGYTALHRASAWGKIGVLKALFEVGADLQLRTINQERAREVALRYNQTECVDYLDWAEAKVALLDVIKNLRETVADPEKVQGRLTKDDKNISLTACNEKQDWVDGTPEATTQDFINQKHELDEILAPIWIKLTEPPPEKPEKK